MHSLHVTVSHGYRNQWYDFVKHVLLNALDLAMKNKVQLRHGLPHDITHHLGLLGGGSGGRRAEVERLVRGMCADVVSFAPQVGPAECRVEVYWLVCTSGRLFYTLPKLEP